MHATTAASCADRSPRPGGLQARIDGDFRWRYFLDTSTMYRLNVWTLPTGSKCSSSTDFFFLSCEMFNSTGERILLHRHITVASLSMKLGHEESDDIHEPSEFPDDE
jgi:hypothetical protein